VETEAIVRYIKRTGLIRNGRIMGRKGELAREKILTATKGLVMRKGFAGTSVDDILRETGISKGSFFHQFKSKSDLAEQLMHWYAEGDMKMFRDFMARAEAAHDDPMDQLMQFLTDFERYLCDPENPPRGCMYALYTYEDDHFENDVKGFVAETLHAWTAMYIRKFQEVIDLYPPVRPVTAKQLGEMIVSVIEGGLILQRAYGNIGMTARQSEQFRAYLELLFPGAEKRNAA
jgi:TetR/AcrR family transcriptional repressor of nem operon